VLARAAEARMRTGCGGSGALSPIGNGPDSSYTVSGGPLLSRVPLLSVSVSLLSARCSPLAAACAAIAARVVRPAIHAHAAPIVRSDRLRVAVLLLRLIYPVVERHGAMSCLAMYGVWMSRTPHST